MEFKPGDRVTTPHGGGTVDNLEQCNHASTGRPPKMASTGRYGVKLDNNPLVGLKDGIAYYWPKELTPKGENNGYA